MLLIFSNYGMSYILVKIITQVGQSKPVRTLNKLDFCQKINENI